MRNYIGTLHTKSILPFQQEFRSSENFAVRFNYFIPFSLIPNPTDSQKNQLKKPQEKWFNKLNMKNGDFKKGWDMKRIMLAAHKETKRARGKKK